MPVDVSAASTSTKIERRRDQMGWNTTLASSIRPTPRESDRPGFPLKMEAQAMVPIGPTNRRFRDIWPQLAVSGCVLLAPPLLMVTGLAYFSSPKPQGAARAAAAASADSRTSPMFVRPDVAPGMSFRVASAEQQPLIAELPPPVEPQPDVVPIAAAPSIDRADGTPAAAPERSSDAHVRSLEMNRTTGIARGASAR
jgi:hypothetical protein